MPIYSDDKNFQVPGQQHTMPYPGTAPPAPQQPFQQAAYGYMNQAAQNAMPSPESLDTAAARVRSRVGAQTSANAQGINDRFLGRGLGASGMYDAAQGQNRAAGLSAYGTGLADVQQDFWNNQMQGANTLTNVGQGYGNLGLGVEQNALGRDQLAEQRRQAIANNLIQQYGNMGQYGNTNFNQPGMQDAFSSIQNYLMQQAGGGAYGGGYGGIPAPAQPGNLQPPFANPFMPQQPPPVTAIPPRAIMRR